VRHITIDDSKVIFLDPLMGALSLFATVMSCSLVILMYKLESLGKGVMGLAALELRIHIL